MKHQSLEACLLLYNNMIKQVIVFLYIQDARHLQSVYFYTDYTDRARIDE